jgi:geranylgeranyl diphosphate synthase type I
MPESNLAQEMLPEIEAELRNSMDNLNDALHSELRDMLAYHMGWIGEGAGPQAAGKRIRPLLVLLTAAAAGGDWRRAISGAAAVELLHNFSLIHDDIEDNSPTRRGRPTVWKKWGLAQAVNTGDALFTLAHLAVMRLEATLDSRTALQAARLLQEACLELTKGQYLDISYEGRISLTQEDYWPMVSGKTAALIAACTELGALTAQAAPSTQHAYRQFGFNLGLAFQALDDLLGIWGDSRQLGKSVSSDLVSGKKSLPVLYGLSQNGPFAQRWREGPVQPDEVEHLAHLLEQAGARDYTQESAVCLTDQALKALEQAGPQGAAGDELTKLAYTLLKRKR